ncbi:hypothetical protein E4U42_005657 [Claviceps africana]|uniref:Uncharacterized protein n=1 Tax=Claviceps africana TaxID=83212 RepID=A0A8K0JBR0_9HYPO|nr:hypothetical protein E4U42_005657 [Claviceps africana]
MAWFRRLFENLTPRVAFFYRNGKVATQPRPWPALELDNSLQTLPEEYRPHGTLHEELLRGHDDSTPLAKLVARMTKVNLDTFYKELGAVGYQFTREFREIKAMRRLAFLTCVDGQWNLVLHPATLDLSFQTVIAVYVPVVIVGGVSPRTGAVEATTVGVDFHWSSSSHLLSLGYSRLVGDSEPPCSIVTDRMW